MKECIPPSLLDPPHHTGERYSQCEGGKEGRGNHEYDNAVCLVGYFTNMRRYVWLVMECYFAMYEGEEYKLCFFQQAKPSGNFYALCKKKFEQV